MSRTARPTPNQHRIEHNVSNSFAVPESMHPRTPRAQSRAARHATRKETAQGRAETLAIRQARAYKLNTDSHLPTKLIIRFGRVS